MEIIIGFIWTKSKSLAFITKNVIELCNIFCYLRCMLIEAATEMCITHLKANIALMSGEIY
jgi:hypothetical protein